MKKRITLMFAFSVLILMMMVGCGNSLGESKSAEANAETEVSTELTETETEVHEHMYVDEVTTVATCENDGVITFTCECGDSYTETVHAVGHVYENYVYNEDATYLADGTETAVCNGCELTDTRTAEGTKLEYTYTEMSATKYAKQSVNIRNLPSTDGEKLGGLSTNQEVSVTGQCNETSWYRIEYNGEVAYVSNNYLVDEKVEVQTATTTDTSNSSGDVCPYPLYEIMYDNRGCPYFYGAYGGSRNMDADNLANTNACMDVLLPYASNGGTVTWANVGTYSGLRVVVRFVGTGDYFADDPAGWGIGF